MSIPDIIAAVGTPLMGIVTDRYGKRTHLIIVSGLCIFLSLALMTFTTLSPAASMSLLGIAYSVFTSSLWPCVPLLVERHQTATAYGLLSVALNITLTVVPIIIGTLRSRYPSNWNYTLFFFLSLSLISILCSLLFFIIDHAKGGVLCRPAYSRADQRSTTRDETEPLLNSENLSDTSSEKEEFVAKVIAEGLVLSVPRVIIHHHHKIPHHSKESTHYHTTHCKCYESQEAVVRKSGRLGKRKKSPIRRNFHTGNAISPFNESQHSNISPLSIAASI